MVLDDALIKDGEIVVHETAESLREKLRKAIDKNQVQGGVQMLW